MNKKIIAMSIFVLFVITVIEVASDASKLTNIFKDPPGNFDHFFKGNNSVDNVLGKDFEELGGFKGHVADVTDTKNPLMIKLMFVIMWLLNGRKKKIHN